MKAISFNQEQKEILINLLQKRLDFWKQEFKEQDGSIKKQLEKMHIIPVISALDKLSNQISFTLSPDEKVECISCVNEDYYQTKSLLNLPTPLSWLIISDEQLKIISRLDNFNDILLKCGYFNTKTNLSDHRKKFRYKYVLDAIQRLKDAESVFLSKTGNADYYKIAFICNNDEYSTFELKMPISWSEIEFTKFGNDKPADYVPTRFSILTTKQKAKELLLSCESQNYPKGVLEAVKYLLS